jgi:ABC-type phosphate/phosphonate transport system substrate-binding protein
MFKLTGRGLGRVITVISLSPSFRKPGTPSSEESMVAEGSRPSARILIGSVAGLENSAVGLGAFPPSALSSDPSWPKEIVFGLISTKSPPENLRLRFGKAQAGWLGPKAYVEASGYRVLAFLAGDPIAHRAALAELRGTGRT